MIWFFSRWIRWMSTGTASAPSPTRNSGSRKLISAYRIRIERSRNDR